MYRIALVLILFVVYSRPAAGSDYCLVQYKSNFSFSKIEYVTDLSNGLTAEVRWGPHGYVGAILQPQVGDQDRVPVERFETFYLALNCSWDSLDLVWEQFTRTFTDRNNCIALVYGSEEAIFQCEHLLESFWLGEDVLGPFQKYEQRAMGPWYQSADYTSAKEELDRLAARALNDMRTAIIGAVSRPKCQAGVYLDSIEVPESDQHLLTNLARPVDASITFTIERDGTVGEILLGQKADYVYEYVMASAARQHQFPERDENCRATWNRVFR